jgi:hypothetical protein
MQLTAVNALQIFSFNWLMLRETLLVCSIIGRFSAAWPAGAGAARRHRNSGR